MGLYSEAFAPNLPLGHCLHVLIPSSSWYWPSRQGAQIPSRQLYPLGQISSAPFATGWNDSKRSCTDIMGLVISYVNVPFEADGVGFEEPVGQKTWRPPQITGVTVPSRQKKPDGQISRLPSSQ